MTDERLYGVLGHPISHSRSPQLHLAAYRELGLNWSYDRYDVTPSGFDAFIEQLEPAAQGFAVTMPLKAHAFNLASNRSETAELTGVANTLLRRADGTGWDAWNTDVFGLAEAISEEELDATHTVVLGGGATATSAVLSALQLGAASVTILARRVDQARELVQKLLDGGIEGRRLQYGSLSDHLYEPLPTLVISTLPGPAGQALEIPDGLMRVPLFDVAYEPWPSPLSLRWQSAGTPAYSGLAMLLHQALLQVRIFVHGSIDTPLADEDRVLAVMRRALEDSVTT